MLCINILLIRVRFAFLCCFHCLKLSSIPPYKFKLHGTYSMSMKINIHLTCAMWNMEWVILRNKGYFIILLMYYCYDSTWNIFYIWFVYKYCFTSLGGKNKKNLGSETINDHFKNLGWKDQKSAQQWRSVITTAGREHNFD